MASHPLYKLDGPLRWASAPKTFSYSSLTTIEQCPLQWQLIYSEYEGLSKFPVRPSPAAVKGEIIHTVLERLFRALALCGFPEIGTSTFRDCVAQIEIRGAVRRLIDEHESTIEEHPRGYGFRLRMSPQQLVNKVVRLFRSVYPQACTTHIGDLPKGKVAKPSREIPDGPRIIGFLEKVGTLCELPLSHPRLGFSGILDLVWSNNGSAVIVDFKSGKVQPEHKKQLTYYAVLWWRCTEEIPSRLEVRYPESVETFSLDGKRLADAEEELASRIQKVTSLLETAPAEARVGNHCTICDVRQFCDPYWEEFIDVDSVEGVKRIKAQAVDIELTIIGEPADHGFEAEGTNGGRFPVVFERGAAQVHGPFKKRERLRILRAFLPQSGKEIELKSWTEVFHFGLH